jgi:Tol biopolymer transport system component
VQPSPGLRGRPYPARDEPIIETVRPALALAPLLFVLATLTACADDPPPPVTVPPFVAQIVRADEGHLTEVRQLTFGGENGAARWAWAGEQVVLQGRGVEPACMHVSRVTLTDPPASIPLVDGEKPSFLPGDRDIVYAASPSCGKTRDRAPGITLDPTFDLFRAKADGSAPTRLTETPGYDAEASVCGKTGGVVFTSMRDGDPDLYRMDADGGHVERLTATVGYDGDPVFDADCTHIAWHAWHPKGKELEDYKKQLAENVVRPTALELWIANANGTDAHQVTYLDAQSSAPSWYPSQARLLFASTFGGESPRDVDLWAIDLDGTNLERVTTAPGPDTSPAFSPDGKSIAFTSSRATRLGLRDTNVFVARWTGAWRHVDEQPADHLMGDAAWLADHARQGRGLGSKGLDDAGEYVRRSFESFGMAPGGDRGFRQDFDATTRVSAQATLEIGGAPVAASEVRALGFSASMAVEGPLTYIGSDDDYAHVDVKGKIVLVRHGGSPRHAAWLAHDRGAVGLLAVADGNVGEPSPEGSDAIPAVIVSNRAMSGFLALVLHGQHPLARLAVTMAPETTKAFNVVARWKASVPDDKRLPGVIVIAAHYDSIGEQSPGADDNASGTAALLQVARSLGEKKPALRRDVVLAAFSGEEQGAAGAVAFVRKPPGGLATKDILAMVDLDMIGRMRDDTLQVFGADTAMEWTDLLRGACNAAGVDCLPATGGGLGGTDRTPFFDAGIPTIHLFTGVHGDRHKAGDTPDKLNATGMAQVARIAEHLAGDVSVLGQPLAFQRSAAPPGEGDARGFSASLGTIPDHAPPPNGQKGMLLAGVRPGGPADKAGLRRGDVLVRLDGHVVGNMDDVKFVMTESRVGARMKAVILRDRKELTVEVTLDTPARR